MPQVSSEHETIMSLKSADHDTQCRFLVHSISKTYNTLRGVAAAIFADMALAVGMSGVANPFVILRSEKGPDLKRAKVESAPASAQCVQLQQLTNDATLTDEAKMLRGFINNRFVTQGGCVRKGTGHDVMQIVGPSDNLQEVSLITKEDPNKPMIKITYRVLVDEYKSFQDTKVCNLHLEQPMQLPKRIDSHTHFFFCRMQYNALRCIQELVVGTDAVWVTDWVCTGMHRRCRTARGQQERDVLQ
jgi:hypothetical protein